MPRALASRSASACTTGSEPAAGPPDRPDEVGIKKGQQLLLLFFLLLASLSIMRLFSSPPAEEIKYSAFKKLVEDRQVADVVITGDVIRGTRTAAAGGKPFAVIRVEDRELLKALDAAGVAYEGRTTDNWIRDLLLTWVLPLLVLVVLWSFLFRRMGAGGPGETVMS